MNHQHEANREKTTPFTGPVGPPDKQDPQAHGGVCIVETCRCGAERRVNSNAGKVEWGTRINADATVRG